MGVDGPEGLKKKGLITIFSESAPLAPSNYCTITKILDEAFSDHVNPHAPTPSVKLGDFHFDHVDHHDASDAAMFDGGSSINTIMLSPAPASKKQKTSVKDVTKVRRSKRIAKIFDGYKDKIVADLAKSRIEKDNIQLAIARGKKKQAKQTIKESKKIITKAFSANIIDSDGLSPPKLPISIVQCIGVEHCLIPPSEVSAEKLTSKSE
jgi:hypothetical protein